MFAAMNLSSAKSDRLDCESKDGNRGERFILDSLLSVLTDWNCGIFGLAPVVLVLLCSELVVADLDGEAPLVDGWDDEIVAVQVVTVATPLPPFMLDALRL
uniref:(northern house mosquito) hypothetical protein n=1 Tax=Culex pipiens TaxID=7175 RepID=A0A8D8G798_CULPI